MADPNALFESLLDQLVEWKNNFQNNTAKMFEGMNIQNWIRIVMIVGTYLLIRPYIVKWGQNQQMKEHEKENAKKAAAEAAGAANPNNFRVGKQKKEKKAAIPGLDSDDEERDENDATGTNWGANARVKQRKLVRKQLAAHEKKLQEEKDALEDKDIEEFLED